MKKTNMAAVILAVLLLAVMTAGCARSSGSEFDPVQSSVFIKQDGSILSATVEHTQQDYYTEENLKSFVEGKVSEFNAAQGKESAAYNKEGAERLPVAIVSCSLGAGQGEQILKYVLEYSSSDMLFAFTGTIRDAEMTLTSLATDSVESRLSKGDLVGEPFVDAKGQSVESSKITSQSKLRVVVSEGPATIQTEGKVVYMTQGCTLQDAYTVTTPGEGISYIVFK